MRQAVLSVIAALATLPAHAGDLDLMVGLRSTMATAMSDHGLDCPDVKQIVEIGPKEDAILLQVRCGPLGDGPAFDRAVRVFAYVDGDYSIESSSLR